MGGAILAGIVASGAPVASIAAVNRTEAKAAALRAPGVESLSLEADPDAAARALAGARLVLVGVKPAGVPDLLAEVRDLLEPDAVVVSLAAGVTLATMEALVPNPVVRTMPNTPALVRRGVTGVAAGGRATASILALVSRVFETVGEVVVVPEERIDALSAISGSGPAYVFFLIEHLTATARGLGFDEEQARVLVEQTFRGASELLAHDRATESAGPAELRRRVTSPKGTTERAIAVLESADLTDLFDRAAAAAIARARELAAG